MDRPLTPAQETGSAPIPHRHQGGMSAGTFALLLFLLVLAVILLLARPLRSVPHPTGTGGDAAPITAPHGPSA